jgi:hypothetical protein
MLKQNFLPSAYDCRDIYSIRQLAFADYLLVMYSMRSSNSTVGSKKYNADIELLSGVSQWKTYTWSQRIPPLALYM